MKEVRPHNAQALSADSWFCRSARRGWCRTREARAHNTFGLMVNVVHRRTARPFVALGLSASQKPLLSDAHFAAVSPTRCRRPTTASVSGWSCRRSRLQAAHRIEPTFYFGFFSSLQTSRAMTRPSTSRHARTRTIRPMRDSADGLYFAPTSRRSGTHHRHRLRASWEWWQARRTAATSTSRARCAESRSAGSRCCGPRAALLLEVPGSDGNVAGRAHGTSSRTWPGARASDAQAAYYPGCRFKRHQVWALAPVRFTIGR